MHFQFLRIHLCHLSQFMILGTLHFDIILNLQKSLKNSLKTSYIPFIQIHQVNILSHYFTLSLILSHIHT